MRKVTREVCEAFIDGRSKVVGNSATDGERLLLHGNCIAQRRDDGRVVMTLAGWPTVTTRERLNGLCELLGLGRPFHQSRHEQYFRDLPIDSTDLFEVNRADGTPVTIRPPAPEA